MIDLVLCLAILLFPVIAMLAVMIRASGPWHSPVPDANAIRRAQLLLEQMLSDDERRNLSGRGYLAVPSGCFEAREYRIWAAGGPVEVYEAGRYSMSLCVEPVEPLPLGDRILAHKLMLEGQEVEFLRVANKLGRAMWLGRTAPRRGAFY